MPGIGPTLPPHLLPKRKRDKKGDDSNSNASDESSHEESDSSNKRPRTLGPSMPPGMISGQRSPSPSIDRNDKHERNLSKSPKVQGPALPPADLSERPSLDVVREGESDDDDDDFGPPLPGSAAAIRNTNEALPEAAAAARPASSKPGREEWMLAPPTAGSRTGSIDPTKMKSKGFSSGKGARPGPSAGADMSLWTETPDEKRKRLEEEMLGVRKAGQPENQDSVTARRDAKALELERKVKIYNDKNRAAPLYKVKADDPEEDDPSQRAFDREKDIAGAKLTNAERKQMMSKAADFGSRFSKGSYL